VGVALAPQTQGYILIDRFVLEGYAAGISLHIIDKVILVECSENVIFKL